MPQESFRATHRNGTAGAVPTKVSTKRGRGFRVRIRNLHGTDGLLVSFDSGRTFYTVAALTEFVENVTFHFFYVQRAAAVDVTYTALLFEG